MKYQKKNLLNLILNALWQLPVPLRRVLPMGAALLLGWAMTSTLFAQPSPLLDLAQLSGSRFLTRLSGAGGENRFGGFGLPVAGALDMDGDGWPEVAAAYMTASPMGRQGAGEIYLAFGSGRIGERIDLAQPRPDVLRIIGSQTRETTGDEIWMADVTGDGLGDLLVGRQNFALGDRSGAGALSIVIGSPQLTNLAQALQVLDLADPPGTVQVLTLVGAQLGDRLGIWMRSGDIDGDGTTDLVVGADQESSLGASHHGAVYLLRGGSHLAQTLLVDLANFGSTPLQGNLARLLPPPGSQEFHFGATCQLADLDGNGRAEILAAASLNRSGAVIGPEANNAHAQGGPPRGRFYIAWDDNIPPPPWPPGYQFDLASAPGSSTIVSGGSLNRNFGEELLGGEDFDGDGQAELFVGDLTGDATGGLRPVSGMGVVFYQAASLKNLVSDLDNLPPSIRTTFILGPNTGAIGSDTAAQGDFDGDSRPDLAIGSPEASPQGRGHAGTIHVLFGQDSRWPETIDTAEGQLPSRLQARVAEIHGARGSAPGDRGDVLYYSAAAGDFDVDGRIDIISNEMVGNGLAPNAVDVGNLVILSGRALLPARPTRNRPMRTRRRE